MKSKMKFLMLCALFLSLGMASCQETEKSIGNVSYTVCFHEGNYIDTVDIKGDAYLFLDSIPKVIETEFHQKGNKSHQSWIVYNNKADSAVLYVESPQVISTNSICNYPIFAKQWDIPKEGQKVYYEGTAYTFGRYLSVPSIDGNNLILTVFEKINGK